MCNKEIYHKTLNTATSSTVPPFFFLLVAGSRVAPSEWGPECGGPHAAATGEEHVCVYMYAHAFYVCVVYVYVSVPWSLQTMTPVLLHRFLRAAWPAHFPLFQII
jgi:hypothetical protein